MPNSQLELQNVQSIDPLLSPERWGHSVGDGDAQRIGFRVNDRASRHAAATVLYHLANGASRMALHTFREGDTFSADEHNPGTVVMIATETLHTIGEKRVPMEDFTGLPQPTRPSIHGDDYLTKRDKGYHYAGGVLWGAVVPKGKRHALYMFPTILGKNIRADLALPHSPTFQVGETIHSQRMVGMEILERVVALNICVNGLADKSKRNRFSLDWLLQPRTTGA